MQDRSNCRYTRNNFFELQITKYGEKTVILRLTYLRWRNSMLKEIMYINDSLEHLKKLY